MSDITIIGNGVIALSIAYRISKLDPNVKINIVGPKEMVGSASIAAGAMISTFGEITRNSLVTHASREKFAISKAALKIWPEWLNELNQQAMNTEDRVEFVKGTYILLNTESGILDSENYYAMKNALIEHNEQFDEISDYRQIDGLNPLSHDRPVGVLYIHNEGYVDSARYLKLLEKILSRNSNISIVDDYVTEVIPNADDTITIKTLKTNEIKSQKAIIANGAYAQQIIEKIPAIRDKVQTIFAGVGYAASLSQDSKNPVKQVLRTTTRAGACGLHALPKGENLYIGATNNVAMMPETKIRAGLVDFLLNCAVTQINQYLYSSTIETFYTGNRPIAFDGYPMIGSTSIKNLWIVNGTYRDGFHMSPVIADHVASSMIKNQNIIKTEIFSPERKLIKSMTRSESIEQYIENYIAGIYEHSAKIPKFMQIDTLEKMIRSQISEIYDQIKYDYGLLPEILLMISLNDNKEKSISYVNENLGRYQ